MIYDKVGFQLCNKGYVQKVKESITNQQDDSEDEPVGDVLEARLKELGMANKYNKKQVPYREKS